MLRVAVTGGIGTGKSHVIRLLRHRAVPTIDADQLARAAVQPGQPASERLRARFGPRIFSADGSLDRARLGRLVFADAPARAALEAIVHPPVRRAIDEWFQRCRTCTGAPFAVADIPLLFETARAVAFEHVVVVACDPATQLERVLTLAELVAGTSSTSCRAMARARPSSSETGIRPRGDRLASLSSMWADQRASPKSRWWTASTSPWATRVRESSWPPELRAQSWSAPSSDESGMRDRRD